MDTNTILVTLFAFLTLLVSVITKEGFDLGTCSDLPITCACGKKGKVIVPVKRCTNSGQWGSYCAVCDKGFRKVKFCLQYRHCRSCSAAENGGCLKCRSRNYGKWCKQRCNCKNGSKCNIRTGRCRCREGYVGKYCESKKKCCTPPPSPANGDVKVSSSSEWSLAQYTCQDGYVLKGPSKRTCSANCTWSDVTPFCEPRCMIPDPGDHMKIAVTVLDLVLSQNTDSQLVQEITVTCEEGYKLIGSETLTCLPGGKWSANIPICKKVVFCPEFTISNAWIQSLVLDESDVYREGTVVQIECDQNFLLKGPETLTCEENGQWNSPFPRCESEEDDPKFTCPQLDPPENGIIVRTPSLDHQPVPGISINYQCNEGFFLVGDDVQVCTDNGSWSGSTPECQKVTACRDPGTPLHAVRCFGRGCSKTALFSDDQCRTSARVGEKTVHLPPGTYSIGTVVEYRCDSIFYTLYGLKRRRCDEHGKWTEGASVCVASCGKRSTAARQMIVNGQTSIADQWPWHAGIARRRKKSWQIACGGSVIHDSWVLTAAHCVTRNRTRTEIPAEDILVYFGKVYRNKSYDDEHVQNRTVQRIFKCPEYNPGNLDSDIALLELSQPVTLSNRIRPVCLPKQKTKDVGNGTECVVTGWGKTETGAYAQQLKMASVAVIPNNECQISLTNNSTENKFEVTENMLCAGNLKEKADACSGDSGGPLVLEDGRKWYIEGVVSWGNGSCGIQYGVYTRVRNFVKWISDTMHHQLPD